MWYTRLQYFCTKGHGVGSLSDRLTGLVNHSTLSFTQAARVCIQDNNISWSSKNECKGRKAENAQHKPTVETQCRAHATFRSEVEAAGLVCKEKEIGPINVSTLSLMRIRATTRPSMLSKGFKARDRRTHRLPFAGMALTGNSTKPKKSSSPSRKSLVSLCTPSLMPRVT